MKVTDLIARLQAIVAQHGDQIAVTGGYMIDDQPLTKVSVLTTNGCAYEGQGTSEDVEGVFFE